MTEKPTLEGLVCQGKLPEAINQLKSLIETLKNEPYTNLVALSGRHSANRKADESETVPKDGISMESNRMRLQFLSILADVREEIEGKLSFFKPIPKDARDHDTLRDFIETGLSRKYVDIKHHIEGQSFIYFSAKEQYAKQEVMVMVLKTSNIEEIKGSDQLRRIMQLKHRNLIQLVDTNFHTYPYYLITELVSGVNLKILLRNTGTLPLYNTKRILLVIGDVMDYLRQKRFGHSGIRPSKIIIDHELEPEISPFDIHHVSDDKRSFKSFVEDCHYFAPEKLFKLVDNTFKGEEMDKANQFCLASLAFEMLTGEKLFAGENASDILLMRHRFFTEAEFRKNRLTHPFIPTRVTAILKKMLAENPDKRYEDMGLALRDIGRIKVVLDKSEELVFDSYRRCLSHAENFAQQFFDRLFAQPGMEALKPQGPNEVNLFYQRFHIALHLMFDIENTIASVEKTTRLSLIESKRNSRAEYVILMNAFVDTVAKCDPRWNSRTGVAEAWNNIKNQILEALAAHLPPDELPEMEAVKPIAHDVVEGKPVSSDDSEGAASILNSEPADDSLTETEGGEMLELEQEIDQDTP